jgi:hypothetical protein
MAKKTKSAPKPKPAAPGKPATKGEPARPAGSKRPGPQRSGLGGLDAAATVLTGAVKPMNCKQLVAQMLTRKLWSTRGKTPAATIGAALARDITAKKDQSRFRKAGRGLFALRRG